MPYFGLAPSQAAASPSPSEPEPPSQTPASAKPEPEFTYHRKYLVAGVGTELMLSFGGVGGAAYFAYAYGRSPVEQIGMMIAPSMWSVVELTRIILAVSSQTDPSRGRRWLAVLMILFISLVGTKSVAQLWDLVFEPRLADVRTTKANLAEAKDNEADLDKQADAAAAKVATATGVYGESQETLRQSNKSLGEIPRPCIAVHKHLKCANDPRFKSMGGALAKVEARANDAETKLNDATGDADAIKGERKEAHQKTRDAARAYDEALHHSPLHLLLSSMTGEDVEDVSKTQMTWMLRIFVLLPSAVTSIGASILNMLAVVPRRRRVPVRMRSAERIELFKAAANDLTKAACAAVVDDVATEFRSASATADKPAPANDNAPKSPMREALGEFLTKTKLARRPTAKKPRGRPRKDAAPKSPRKT